MNISKPGQLCTINNTVYRAKRATERCNGCDLDNFYTCPNIVDMRNKTEPPILCQIHRIILKRVTKR